MVGPPFTKGVRIFAMSYSAAVHTSLAQWKRFNSFCHMESMTSSTPFPPSLSSKLSFSFVTSSPILVLKKSGKSRCDHNGHVDLVNPVVAVNLVM